LNNKMLSSIQTIKKKLPRIFTGFIAKPSNIFRQSKFSTFSCIHVGDSMNPTLNTSDILEIVPCRNTPLQVGEIILFLPKEKSTPVVHRISHITSEGIRTSGDNNSCADDWVLQPSDVLGRVISVWRGQKRQAIAGGKPGMLTYSFFRSKRIVDRSFSRAIRPIYHFLSHRSIIHSLLPNRLKPRIVAFQLNGKKQLKLMMNCRQLGYYDTQQKRWHIRRPFRLFVDEFILTTPYQINFK
jgi:hypothetical protein